MGDMEGGRTEDSGVQHRLEKFNAGEQPVTAVAVGLQGRFPRLAGSAASG